METRPDKPLIGVAIFEEYELLDTYGPLELFLMKEQLFGSVVLASETGEVRSSQAFLQFAPIAMRS